MKKWIMLACSFFLFLVGCSNEPKGVKDFSGYLIMVDTTSQTVLVSEFIPSTEERVPLVASYTITKDTKLIGTSGKKYAFADLSVGFLVDPYHTGQVMESYPTQATATTLIIHDDEASIEKAKALSIAIQELNHSSQWLVVSLEKEKTDVYEVSLVELFGSDQPVTFKVDIKNNQVVE